MAFSRVIEVDGGGEGRCKPNRCKSCGITQHGDNHAASILTILRLGWHTSWVDSWHATSEQWNQQPNPAPFNLILTEVTVTGNRI